MKGDSMFGRLLTEVQAVRKFSRERAIADLWRRNHVLPGAPGYKLVETAAVSAGGTEVTEYRLYKLLDATVTTVRAEVKHEALGLEAIVERNR